MLIPPRGVRSQSRGGKLDFLAKVATKNSQNRQLAEIFQIFKAKVVGHQILTGKVVSQASFESRSPKLGRSETCLFYDF